MDDWLLIDIHPGLRSITGPCHSSAYRNRFSDYVLASGCAPKAVIIKDTSAMDNLATMPPMGIICVRFGDDQGEYIDEHIENPAGVRVGDVLEAIWELSKVAGKWADTVASAPWVTDRVLYCFEPTEVMVLCYDAETSEATAGAETSEDDSATSEESSDAETSADSDAETSEDSDAESSEGSLDTGTSGESLDIESSEDSLDAETYEDSFDFETYEDALI